VKRYGNLYGKIYGLDNLRLADTIARKGKSKQRGVIDHDKNREANILALHDSLKNKTYTTSRYTTFTIKDPKERLIHCLPYYPDRIVHHAIMNVIKPIVFNTFTADTYSCIEGRGVHKAVKAVKKALTDVPGTKYCLKLDIRKFYPSIDHDVLKALLRKKFKDNDLLWLLDGIIDSAEGMPIGNYASQILSNFYLTYFDHWLKETKHIKYYFRYADDMVIFSDSKAFLHSILADIRKYLKDELKLTVKDNYQVFPVDERGLDFLGYVFRHPYTLLRKRNKKNFARMMAKRRNKQSIASYKGLASHCDSRHLVKKLIGA